MNATRRPDTPSWTHVEQLVGTLRKRWDAGLYLKGYLAEVHPIFYLRKVWSLAWTTPVAALVNVALNALLIPWIGLMGAAYTTVVTYTAQYLLVRRVRRRLVAVPWHRGTATRAWAVAAVGAAVGALLPAAGVWLWLRGAAAAILVVVFVARLRDLLTRRAA